MKRTAFFPLHEKLGAKIVEFGGFDMPVLYTGIIEEHKAVRERVGVFDVSHMGEFEIRGPGALALLQKITTNDVSKLSPGKAQYTCMTLGEGGTPLLRATHLEDVVEHAPIYVKDEGLNPTFSFAATSTAVLIQ